MPIGLPPWTASTAENIPEDYNNGSYYEGDRSLGDTIATVIGFIIMIAIICFVVSVLTSIGRYVGGFGTRYVFVNGLWYPGVPGGRPQRQCGPSPAHPRAVGRGGFGGGSQGGALAAVASAAATAMPAAAPAPVPVPAPAARRAGCSANLYGAIHFG